jgi:hypothetical protein
MSSADVSGEPGSAPGLSMTDVACLLGYAEGAAFTLTLPLGTFYLRVHSVSGSQRSIASNEIRVSTLPTAPSSPGAVESKRSPSLKPRPLTRNVCNQEMKK